MKQYSALALLVGLLAPGLTFAQDAKKNVFQVPYQLTVPKHIHVRAKINGKGPFNFILDTGAPMLIVAEEVGKQIGLEKDKNGWSDLDKFEIEGGVVVPKARAYVHTPFQLEGMNGMGLAGVKLHGLIGYDILARYQMKIDFTKSKMEWTQLDWNPKVPFRIGGKGGSGGGGLEVVGNIMKMLGGLLGRGTNQKPVMRGFLGVELVDAGLEEIRVKSILEDSPAGMSGLKVGDQVTKFQGRTVLNVEDVHRFARKVRAGKEVKITVLRDGEKQVVTLTAGEGL